MVSPLIALMKDQWRRLTAAGHPVAMISSGMSDEAARDGPRPGSRRRGADRLLRAGALRLASLPRRAGGAARRPVGGRRGALRLRVGPRLPPRLPAPARDRRAARPADGHGLHGDRDRGGRGARSSPASASATRSGSAPASTVPTSPSTSCALEGKGSKARRLALLEAGLSDPANRPAIVYCGTRKDTDEVAATLRERGPAALAYHAGMEAEDRDEAQRRFMADEVEVIVATNAFGMGVDKADVRSVWHMAIPTSLEAYYQEAGRAGRDGLPAKAVLLAMRTDLGRLVRFNEQRSPRPGDRPRARLARLPHDQGLHLLRPLPAAAAARPLWRPRGGGAAGPLLRLLRPRPVGCPTRRRSPSRRAEARGRRSRGAPEVELSPADAPLFERAQSLAARGGRRASPPTRSPTTVR